MPNQFSLEFYGIKSREEAMDTVRRARNHADLSEGDAMFAALDEVKRVRKTRFCQF